MKTDVDVSTEMRQIVAGLDARARVRTAPLSATVDSMMRTARWADPDGATRRI